MMSWFSKLIKKEEDADWAPVLPGSVQFRKQKQFCLEVLRTKTSITHSLGFNKNHGIWLARKN